MLVSTSALRSANVTIVSNQNCGRYNLELLKNAMCAKFQEGARLGAGDDGGGLVCVSDGNNLFSYFNFLISFTFYINLINY